MVWSRLDSLLNSSLVPPMVPTTHRPSMPLKETPPYFADFVDEDDLLQDYIDKSNADFREDNI